MSEPTVGFGAAFAAGIVSFLSPCVLPLVPGYVSFMTGLSLEELAGGERKDAVARHAGWESLCFVAGFSLVFTLLGATASAAGRLLAGHLPVFSKVAGAIIMVFGLHITGVVPIKQLYFHKRADTSAFAPGLVGSFLMGLAFAFGWTPCIGPILGGILGLAAVQETVGQGMRLLFVYSLGLGLPFLATGFAVRGFLRFFARYKRYIRAGEIASGVLLIGVGALIFFDRLTWILRWLPDGLARFQW